MINELFTGYITGLGLIVAIGPQNAFLIKQGIKKEHHILIASICSISDALLILLGVFGIGSIISKNPEFIKYSSIFGAVLLCFYGVLHIKSVFNKKIDDGGIPKAKSGIVGTVLVTLGLTFLNPHVYLDTVILLGSISSSYKGNGNYYFGFGAMLASLSWFFLLAIASEKLSPLFQKRNAWKVLDLIIAIIMFSISYKLLIFALNS